METAKIFENGRSQAVRLPKDYRFQENEVLIHRIGQAVILMPKNDPWRTMMDSLDLFTEDFLASGIEELPVQERDTL